MSACPPILLQKSFCVTEYKFSGPYARRSNNHLRDLHYPAMNSRATSVMARRLHRSAIAVCLVCFREIDPTAFWEFCNTICQVRTFANAEAHRRVRRPQEGHSRPQCRRAPSHSTTGPLADAFQKWLRTKRGLISQKGKLAERSAMRSRAGRD